MNTLPTTQRRETGIEEAKKCILMKSGLAFWVKVDTAEKLERATTEPGFQHQFVQITEIGQTINTSQIEGFYTRETYTEIQRMKEGERKCAWGNWHKRKEECQCEAEMRKKAREEADRRRQQEEYKPLTPEEQERSREMMRYMNEEAALKGPGIFRDMFRPGNKSGRFMRWSSVAKYEAKTGLKADLTGLQMEPTPEPKERVISAIEDHSPTPPPQKKAQKAPIQEGTPEGKGTGEDFEREARENGII